MAKRTDPAHLPPFSPENPRPQCPAVMHDSTAECHLLFGHDGLHVHFTARGSEIAFRD